MPWTDEQKAFVVESYLKTESIKTARINLQRKYGLHKRDAPTDATILSWVKAFRTCGSVKKLACVEKNTINGAKPGRPVSVRTPEKVAEVRAAVLQSPKRSLRKRSQAMRLKKSSMWLILKKDLKMTAYHIQICHSLSDHDKDLRVIMCRWFLRKLREDPTFLDEFWWSDEAYFQLTGYVNSKNAIHWGTEKPNEVISKPLHSKKVSAWCAFSKHGVIGPYWFEEDGQTVTVNTERYLRIALKPFWNSLGRRQGIQRDLQWFQQDGAPPHTALESRMWLEDKFGDHIVSYKTPNVWSPHSPDLSPLNHFLWGYCKNNVYHNKPATLEQLKTNITRHIRAITPATCAAVVDNFKRRIQVCLDQNGGHIEHLPE